MTNRFRRAEIIDVKTTCNLYETEATKLNRARSLTTIQIYVSKPENKIRKGQIIARASRQEAPRSTISSFFGF
jgi:hypothetical protein